MFSILASRLKINLAEGLSFFLFAFYSPYDTTDLKGMSELTCTVLGDPTDALYSESLRADAYDILILYCRWLACE